MGFFVVNGCELFGEVSCEVVRSVVRSMLKSGELCDEVCGGRGLW